MKRSQTPRRLPNLPWAYIATGSHRSRYVFLYQPEPDPEAFPSHLFSIGREGIKHHITLKPRKQTTRALEVLRDLEAKRPELIPYLDEDFFETLLFAISHRNTNHLLIRQELARIHNQKLLDAGGTP